MLPALGEPKNYIGHGVAIRDYNGAKKMKIKEVRSLTREHDGKIVTFIQELVLRDENGFEYKVLPHQCFRNRRQVLEQINFIEPEDTIRTARANIELFENKMKAEKAKLADAEHLKSNYIQKYGETQDQI